MKSSPPGSYLKITVWCPFTSTWRGMVGRSLEMVMHLVFAMLMVRWLSEIQFTIVLMSHWNSLFLYFTYTPVIWIPHNLKRWRGTKWTKESSRQTTGRSMSVQSVILFSRMRSSLPVATGCARAVLIVSWARKSKLELALSVSLSLKDFRLQGIPLLYVNSPPLCPKDDCREELTAEDGAKVFPLMFCDRKIIKIN